MQEDYEWQIEAINKVMGNLYEEKAELENGIDTENPFLSTFRKYENIEVSTHQNAV
ncbi:hypothetical protein [Fontibacillus panacisegetis]|uniref:hypothetical protein n=1 Tax=Fontibacillus panacisegetis TaxID=670482 RepID=UPI000A919FF5|nr:hypothetical protein [Fontibacillus panacisegetis]